MIREAVTIRERLAKLAAEIEKYAGSTENLDQQRYARSSSAIVRYEEKKLNMGLSSNEDASILWALRSIADMMKGLIDIGSDIREAEPSIWQEAEELASLAHGIERDHRLDR